MRITELAAGKAMRVVHRASGALARAAVYVLIALVTFYLVTLITARR
jgi:hypothetical protein